MPQSTSFTRYIWNTTWLQKAIDHLKQNYAFDESLSKHISHGYTFMLQFNYDIQDASVFEVTSES